MEFTHKLQKELDSTKIKNQSYLIDKNSSCNDSYLFPLLFIYSLFNTLEKQAQKGKIG